MVGRVQDEGMPRRGLGCVGSYILESLARFSFGSCVALVLVGLVRYLMVAAFLFYIFWMSLVHFHGEWSWYACILHTGARLS